MTVTEDSAVQTAQPDAGVRGGTQRQFPKWKEVRPLLQMRRPILNPVESRLQGALSIDELRKIAFKKTPRSVFDYVDGGADAELTLRRNREAFSRVELVPEYLTSVANPKLSTSLLGYQIDMPLVFAPTGYTRMMHHDGEAAVARVAARSNLPYTLSTVGTSTIEEVAAAAPKGMNWFQLYLTNDERINTELLQRAENSGCDTVMLTIDTPVAARHLKDLRNGLTIPPSLSSKTILDIAMHPLWALNKLTTAPITFANLSNLSGESLDAVRVADVVFEPTLNYRHLEWLRERWHGRLLIKGVLSPETARKVMAHGADGVVVSNHGGRQLDKAPSTLSILPEIRLAVGPEATVLLDSGVTHGSDMIAARALGADAVMIGRAYLYGLMAGGERGVTRAIEIIREEYTRSLQLLGLNSTEAITRSHIRGI